MNSRFQRITPFLWFNDQAEQAVKSYTSIFANSGIVATTHYSKEAAQACGRRKGSVRTIAFELDGQPFTALNGGPHFMFSGAVSFVVNCQSQEEVDYFRSKLSEGGGREAQQRGWLKDCFGMCWQVVPTALPQLLSDPDPARARKAMSAKLKMKKIQIADLKKAAA